MTISILKALTRSFRIGRAMHPTLNASSLKHQTLLLTQVLTHLPAIRKWFDISDNPSLTLALQRFPLISGAMYWPYLNHTWPLDQKLATIDQHYRMLTGRAAIIAEATLNEVELAKIEEYTGLRLVLDKTEWFLREGEIVLNLFVNDQRFYSIAFTLGVEACQPVIFVGALQGSNSDTAQDVYRNMTHALYGMRPRDFIMVAFKLLCRELEIFRILAVSSDKRQHNSPYFGEAHKDRVIVAYDQVWLVHRGVAQTNGFYDIPAMVKHKDVEDVATRKRAAYKRRYQMLDKLAMDIKNSVAQHASPPCRAP